MAVSGYINIPVGGELEKFLTSRSLINVGETLEGKVVQLQDNNRVLIDFGKFRAVAQINFPVNEGSVIPVSVTSKEGGQLVMRIAENLLSTSIAGGKTIGGNQQTMVLSAPVIGDDIENVIQKIDKALNNGAVSVEQELTRQTATAIAGKPEAAVKGPEVLTTPEAAVVKQESVPLIGGKGEVSVPVTEAAVTDAKSSNLLTRDGAAIKLTPELSELLTVVKEHFKPFDSTLMKDIPDLTRRLKRVVEKSGIFHEMKGDASTLLQNTKEQVNPFAGTELLKPEAAKSPQDLKPVLNLLKDRFEEIAAKTGDSFKGDAVKIRNSIEMMLYNIESRQQEAVEKKPAVNRDDSGQHIFTFALPFKETHHRGKLKVYLNKKTKKGKKNGYKVSLLLNMGNLGDIRSDFLMVERKVTITLFVKSEVVKVFIEEYIDELEELISGIFRQQELNVVVSPRNIQNFDSEDVEEEYHSSSLVDLKA